MNKKSYRRLIHIVSLFAEKSHRRPSDVETRIAHPCVKPKDQSHLDLSDTNQTYLGAKDSQYNPKIYSVIEKRINNWFSEIGIFSEF